MFDDITQQVSREFRLGGRGKRLMAGIVLAIENYRGGLWGVLDNFRAVGLGSIAATWVDGKDPRPISGDDLERGMGSDVVTGIAAHAGLTKQTAIASLSVMIPRVIDRMTPGGRYPEAPAGKMRSPLTIIAKHAASPLSSAPEPIVKAIADSPSKKVENEVLITPPVAAPPPAAPAPLTTDDGQQTTDDGQQTTDNRQRTTAPPVAAPPPAAPAPLTTDDGQLTTDNRQRTTAPPVAAPPPAAPAPLTTDDGQLTTDNGQQTTDNRQRTTAPPVAAAPPAAPAPLTTDDGQLTTDDGQQTTDNRQRTTAPPVAAPPPAAPAPLTTDDGQRTTDDGQRTTDNRQLTTQPKPHIITIQPRMDTPHLNMPSGRIEPDMQILKGLLPVILIGAVVAFASWRACEIQPRADRGHEATPAATHTK